MRTNISRFKQIGGSFIELLIALLLLSVTLVGVTTMSVNNLKEMREHQYINFIRSTVQSFIATVEANYAEPNRALYQFSALKAPQKCKRRLIHFLPFKL